MEKFDLKTARLVLNQLRPEDTDAITKYCSEPVFEHFMTTPWPYEQHHAEWFVATGAPHAWSTGAELTWAIRANDEDPLLGVICVRLPSGSLGFWLGSDHRGNGFMSEAVRVVVDSTFDRTDLKEVRWECVVGNTASMRVAQSVGFSYTGEAFGDVPGRSGEAVKSWTAAIRRGETEIQHEHWPA